MIEFVGTGIVITTQWMYLIITFGIVCMIQPWSMTFKTIGCMIGIGAYALMMVGASV